MLENRILELSDIEIREDNGEHHIIALVAPWHATFDTGQYVERLGRSVFDKSIKERGSKIPLMHGHDRERFPIGMAGSWSNDNNGLIADFRMALTERSVEALALAKDGYVTGFSVGFHPVRSSESKQDGRRQITRLEAKLDHVALLTSPNEPAYGDAQLVMAREFNADDKEQAPMLAKWRHLMSSQD